MTNIEKWLVENGYEYLKNEDIYFNEEFLVSIRIKTRISDFAVFPLALGFCSTMSKDDIDGQIKVYEKSTANCLSEYRKMVSVRNLFGNVGESAENRLEGSE